MNNRILTATGGSSVNAESGLTFDGSSLSTTGNAFLGNTYGYIYYDRNASGYYVNPDGGTYGGIAANLTGSITNKVMNGYYAQNIENGNESPFQLRTYVNSNSSGSVTFKQGLFYSSTENATINYWRGGSTTGGFITFNTDSGNERLRITTGGAMGLGKTPTDTAGRFEATNDIVAFASSDIRWKTNVTNIPNALDKLSKINGVSFDWIEDTPIHGNTGHDIGVIAQEIEVILPEIVSTRESGMKAVQYEKIIPLLIEAIKEQQKQIDELKNKNN